MSQSSRAEFAEIVDRALSRRDFVSGSIVFGAGAFVLGASACVPAGVQGTRFHFKPVPANTLDTVTVPEGFGWHIVALWGDPLWSKGVAFDHETRGTGESQELAFGDNADGMALFTSGDRFILAVNNEYNNRAIAFHQRESKRPETVDDVRKSKAAHGVSICEIAQDGGRWSVVKDSPFNRRITADTPVEITGPARGHELLKTAADPSGTRALGTYNDCSNGVTPWGTYLACEENFHYYYSSSDEGYVPTPAMKRYGISNAEHGYRWVIADERFDISKHPNESNRAGYVVEIDPLDPASTPRKHTALGRFAHENAAVVVAENGHIVVYLGDDSQGEFLYRFVSHGKYIPGGENQDLLESGKLYAARFDDQHRGEWVELTPESTGMSSQAEVCIHTRLAASAVGATTMDRPEWVAAHPDKAEVYCSLTNNTSRGVKPNAGGDAMPVGGPNPRAKNRYGQIVRWAPDGADHTAAGFSWDLYVMAGNPAVHSDARAGSANVTVDNMFNGPDGLGFDSRGRLWIETDGNFSNEGDAAGMGNNQLLVGDPESGEIHRFLVGPRECEITGITWSPDYKTLFIGIQHPGAKGNSHFPDGGDTAPRSAVVAITREDGGAVG